MLHQNQFIFWENNQPYLIINKIFQFILNLNKSDSLTSMPSTKWTNCLGKVSAIRANHGFCLKLPKFWENGDMNLYFVVVVIVVIFGSTLKRTSCNILPHAEVFIIIAQIYLVLFIGRDAHFRWNSWSADLNFFE